MAFEIRPYPEWSWSQSRDATFRDCEVKYYYHYYGSHNGWLRDASPEQKASYRLKQLTNLYMLLGDEVHQLAERAVKLWREGEPLPSAEAMDKRIRARLNQAYLDSKQRERWMHAPKKSDMLHEMYYGGELPAARVGQIKERIGACVSQFLNSESWRELTEQGAAVREVEELNTFCIDGNKIYVKLDLLYERADGTWVIVDWKTGKESESNERQMLLYALFLRDKYGIPYDRMEIHLEYLLNGQASRIAVDLAELAEVEREVAESVAGMKALLKDAGANEPLPMEAFEARPSRYACGSCNFAELCRYKAV